jgi:hypothetical protein
MDKYTVRSSVDGSVDVNATLAAYGNALTKWVAENEMSTDSIRDAVDAAFDSQPAGERITGSGFLCDVASESPDCAVQRDGGSYPRLREGSGAFPFEQGQGWWRSSSWS